MKPIQHCGCGYSNREMLFGFHSELWNSEFNER